MALFQSSNILDIGADLMIIRIFVTWNSKCTKWMDKWLASQIGINGTRTNTPAQITCIYKYTSVGLSVASS